MRTKRPISSLRGIKTIHSAGIRAIPKVQRSGYLDLYTLGRERDRLEVEISALDKRKSTAEDQLANIVKRVVRLRKETSEAGQVKSKKTICGARAKPIKTMGINY